MLPALAADSGLLGTTEGRAQIAQEPAINPGNATVNLWRNAKGARDILGPDSRSQPIRGVIGQGNDFLFRIEGADMAAGTEDFLIDHPGVICQPSPDSGLHPGTPGEFGRHVGHAATEYYSDYGVYDVKMTVPGNFVLGATGRQVDRKENSDGTVTYTYHQKDVVRWS